MFPSWVVTISYLHKIFSCIIFSNHYVAKSNMKIRLNNGFLNGNNSRCSIERPVIKCLQYSLENTFVGVSLLKRNSNRRFFFPVNIATF